MQLACWQSGQDFGRLVRAHGCGEYSCEGSGSGCLNLNTVVWVVLRISLRIESKTWEILGFREAIILDLNSVLFYECGNVNVYEF